jgi:hypothetical protein
MLHLVTYSTSPEKAQFFFESAKLHGLTVENLGIPSASPITWYDKINTVRNKLKDLPDEDILCFADAYDVIINADANTIIQSYLSCNSPIVFGAEIMCFPDSSPERIAKFPASKTPFRFLNSGIFIGTVKYLKTMYDIGFAKYDMSLVQKGTDQLFYQNCFLDTKDLIGLDYTNKFVVNMDHVPWTTLEIESGRIHFTPSKTTPCFVHFNGMSYLERDLDFQKLPDGSRGFNYYAVYSRTFIALLGAKVLSKQSQVKVHLTGNGHSY